MDIGFNFPASCVSCTNCFAKLTKKSDYHQNPLDRCVIRQKSAIMQYYKKFLASA